jgi:hypothetical protein
MIKMMMVIQCTTGDAYDASSYAYINVPSFVIVSFCVIVFIYSTHVLLSLSLLLRALKGRESFESLT